MRRTISALRFRRVYVSAGLKHPSRRPCMNLKPALTALVVTIAMFATLTAQAQNRGGPKEVRKGFVLYKERPDMTPQQLQALERVLNDYGVKTDKKVAN